MINKILNENSYKDLASKQLKELLLYIQNNNYEFNLLANIDGINFNPKLPEDIYNKLDTFVLFSLAKFTLSSLKLKENHIEFEAGFGESNFGSICTIPYYAILQITIDNSIIFINPVASVQKYFINDYDEDTQIKRSMNAFKINK
jgi:hypothetical protein